MCSMSERVVVVGKKSISSYLIDIAVFFQEGVSSIIIKGYGKYISKAVDLYNALANKMRDSVVLENIAIGSEPVAGRVKTYIAIKISRKF